MARIRISRSIIRSSNLTGSRPQIRGGQPPIHQPFAFAGFLLAPASRCEVCPPPVHCRNLPESIEFVPSLGRDQRARDWRRAVSRCGVLLVARKEPRDRRGSSRANVAHQSRSPVRAHGSSAFRDRARSLPRRRCLKPPSNRATSRSPRVSQQFERRRAMQNRARVVDQNLIGQGETFSSMPVRPAESGWRGIGEFRG